jgi:hypothetical protein
MVVLVGERVEQGLQLRGGAGLDGLAASHFLRVCWKRSTLPQVVGWLGREFFWVTPRRRSSASRALRPPLPPAKRVVKTIALSVKVEAGGPKRATAARKRSRAIGPVTGWWAVTSRASRLWSSVQVRTSASGPGVRLGWVSREWVKSACQVSLGRVAANRWEDDLGRFFGVGVTSPAIARAERVCPSPQDLDEQHPRVQHRHHKAQHNPGNQPVEPATGAKQQRHPASQQRQDRHLGYHDPTGQHPR